MVKNTGKTLRTDTVKPVNVPEPVQVEESSSGIPTVVKTRLRQKITAIEDYWRIDDEWWRSETVSRLYYAVTLISGQRIIMYKNLIDNCWYKQLY